MLGNKKRAFTLTELLVVVIVLGTLAAVAVPKFSRVLETRRTGEAEGMLSAVRMEQEKRCSLGQNYTGDFSKISTVAYAKSGESQGKTSNYTYTLTSTGIEASRGGKDYVLKIPSYKTGEICCEGSGCDALNKSYPLCSSLSLPAADECAASDVVVPEDPCDSNPNSCSCSAYAASHRCECDADYASANACECNPSTATCCGEGEEWDAASGSCKPTDECVDSYGTATRVTSGTDTCDGDSNGKYTCDGQFSGTCTDIFSPKIEIVGTASYQQDPFLKFKNEILLAGNTGLCVSGVYCGMNGSTTVCCPKGYYCDWDDAVLNPKSGTCKKGEGPDDSGEVAICPSGEEWDARLGMCVKVFEGNEDEDTDGDGLPNPVLLMYKREVTCCGDTIHETPKQCVGESSRECGCRYEPEEVYNEDLSTSNVFGIPPRRGTQTRTCVNGEWSEWSACTGYTKEAGVQCHGRNWEWTCVYNASSDEWDWRVDSHGYDCDYESGGGSDSGSGSSSGYWALDGYDSREYSCGSSSINQATSYCAGISKTAPSGSCSVGSTRTANCSVNDYCPGGRVTAEWAVYVCK